jgi:hypothetical protein
MAKEPTNAQTAEAGRNEGGLEVCSFNEAMLGDRITGVNAVRASRIGL